jgi:hypothetical protein
MSVGCGANLFGTKSQFIKTNGGDFIAVDGSNTRERLILSDLRIPYKQILKSRVILKVGQVNYLLNHLGLGDNATFLAIKVAYDAKSVIEADNYVNWSYYDDITRINHFADMMVLTGNSSNRIPQIYLTNPSTKYPVYLDIMVAVLDDNYSFFNDLSNQLGVTFTGLDYTDIRSYVVGESIVINDKSQPVLPLIFINIADIASIERNSNILVINDVSLKDVYLVFNTEEDAIQAQSLLSYVIENPNTNIDNLDPISDNLDPIIYFYKNVGYSSYPLSMNGDDINGPFDTSMGNTFSATYSLQYDGSPNITKSSLIGSLVDYIYDDRDGYMYIMDSNILITDSSNNQVSQIGLTGSYTLKFDFSDIAQNYLDEVIINLNIIE